MKISLLNQYILKKTIQKQQFTVLDILKMQDYLIFLTKKELNLLIKILKIILIFQFYIKISIIQYIRFKGNGKTGANYK